MIVCLCHGVSERAVDSCVDAGARTVEEVGLMSGAGMGCGACHCQIKERIACGGCPAVGLLQARKSAQQVATEAPLTAA
ncbi:MAG: bacterioferritin-associated ferredoxin [Myxococcota bacterium]